MRHRKTLLIALGLLLTTLVIVPTLVLAQAISTPPQNYIAPVPLTNPIGANSVEELVGNIVKTILGVVGALAFLMFVYGGVLWLTSAGNSQRIEKGKETLIWASVGLAIIFSSYAILNIVLDALAV